MRLLFIYCGGEIPRYRPDFSVSFDDTFAQRVLRHLVNEEKYCHGCEALCDHCRDTYGIDFSSDIVDVLELPAVLPFYIDRPRDYLGEQLAPHDITLAINVHEELLLALPTLAAEAGSEAIIAPCEHPAWISRWARDTVGKRCRELGLGWAAPKPFCSLTPGRHPAIDRFVEYFRVGFPELEVTVKDGLIRAAKVRRSAPCGNTYYVAFNLMGATADASVIERVAKYWHSFPCVASMEMDRELGDTILHLSGYHHYEAIRQALAEAGITIEVPRSRHSAPAPVPKRA